MRNWFSALVAALALVGCKAPAGAGAKADAGSSAARSDAGPVSEELVAQLPPEYQMQLAHLLKSREMAESLKSGEAPEVAKKMIDHTRRIVELLRKNIGDCAGLETALKAYLDANKAELSALRAKGNAEQANLNPDERAKRTIQTFMLLSSLAPEIVQVQSMLLKNCPGEAQRVAAQLKSVTP